MKPQPERPVLSDMCETKKKKCRSERRGRMKKAVSVFLLMAVAALMLGCARVNAPLDIAFDDE